MWIFISHTIESMGHFCAGNVMGNVIWATRGFQANGRLSINSSGHKDMYLGLDLGGSVLEAKVGNGGRVFVM